MRPLYVDPASKDMLKTIAAILLVLNGIGLSFIFLQWVAKHVL